MYLVTVLGYTYERGKEFGIEEKLGVLNDSIQLFERLLISSIIKSCNLFTSEMKIINKYKGVPGF